MVQEKESPHVCLLPKAFGLFSYVADVAFFSKEEMVQDPQVLFFIDRKEKHLFYQSHKERFKQVLVYTSLCLFYFRLFRKNVDDFLRIGPNAYITKKDQNEVFLLYLTARLEISGKQFTEAQEILEKLNKSHSIIHVKEQIFRLNKERQELESKLFGLDQPKQIPVMQKLQEQIKKIERSIEDLEKKQRDLHLKKRRLKLLHKSYETDVKHFESLIQESFSQEN